MNPLKTNKQVLTWLSGIPPDLASSKRKRIAYITFTLFVILGNLFGFLAGAIFIYKNFSTNFEKTIFALLNTVTCGSALYQSIVTVILRCKLTAIFQGLSAIYKESK